MCDYPTNGSKSRLRQYINNTCSQPLSPVHERVQPTAPMTYREKENNCNSGIKVVSVRGTMIALAGGSQKIANKKRKQSFEMIQRFGKRPLMGSNSVSKNGGSMSATKQTVDLSEITEK